MNPRVHLSFQYWVWFCSRPTTSEFMSIQVTAEMNCSTHPKSLLYESAFLKCDQCFLCWFSDSPLKYYILDGTANILTYLPNRFMEYKSTPNERHLHDVITSYRNWRTKCIKAMTTDSWRDTMKETRTNTIFTATTYTKLVSYVEFVHALQFSSSQFTHLT